VDYKRVKRQLQWFHEDKIKDASMKTKGIEKRGN